MEENRYTLAGWLAIAQAIIFPVAVVVGIIQGIISIKAFGYRGPTLGPSTIMMIIFTVFSVYTLSKFRQFLNEHYNFHKVDLLITFAIWWNIIFQLFSIALTGLIFVMWPMSPKLMTIIELAYFSFAMITAGIIDIFIGVNLLRIKEIMSNLLTVYSYLILIGGICELSVILAFPVAFLLVPASCIILAMIFLKEKEQVEFV